MSPARGGFGGGGRPRLVLLRGGLDDDSARERGGSDWAAFCRRIGWQSSGPALAVDFEERLAARVFDEPAFAAEFEERLAARVFDEPALSADYEARILAGVFDEPAFAAEFEERLAARVFDEAAPWADEEVRIGGRLAGEPAAPASLPHGAMRRAARARPRQASAVERGTSVGGPGVREHRRATRLAAMVATLAVAAAVAIVTAAALSSSGERAADVVLRPAPDVAATAAPDPSPVEAPPPKVLPEEAPLLVAPTEGPEDAPREVRPPGALYAKRGSSPPARRAPGEPALAEPEHSGAAVASVPAAFVDPELLAPAEPVALASRTDALGAGSGALVAASWSAEPEPGRWVTLPARSGLSAPVVGDWSVDDAGDRWYGVGLSAPREPTGLGAGVRAMAQIDLGKAIGKLQM